LGKASALKGIDTLRTKVSVAKLKIEVVVSSLSGIKNRVKKKKTNSEVEKAICRPISRRGGAGGRTPPARIGSLRYS